MKMVRAKHFTPVTGQPRQIDLVVLHTMEAPENAQTAENVAAWFAGPNAPRASVHYCIDSDSIVQTLDEKDVAWGAAGANHNGVHLEHAGYARQTAAEWADPYSQAMLLRSAELVAGICLRHNIPVAWVDAAGLAAGARGITTHAAVNQAFKKGSHWDPGPGFPAAAYLELVASFMAPVSKTAVPALDEWVRVGDFLVCPRPIAPVGIREAQELASELGCELPSPALVDAIWRAADLRLAPITRTTPNGTEAEMNAPELVADQAARIEAQIAGRPYRLLAGTCKDVVRGPGGKVGIYGWHRLDGTPIQPPYYGHAPSWRDYSQGLRLVRRSPAGSIKEAVTTPELPPPPPSSDRLPVLEDDGGASRRRATLDAATEIFQELAKNRDDDSDDDSDDTPR